MRCGRRWPCWSPIRRRRPSARLPPPPASPTGCASAGILIRLVTGCAWVDAERSSGRRGVRHDVAGPSRRVDRRRRVRPLVARGAWPRYDRVIGLRPAPTSPIDASQHKAPVRWRRHRTQPRPIAPSTAGSGRWSPTAPASRSAGRPAPPTVPTPPCWPPPSTTSTNAACSDDVDTSPPRPPATTAAPVLADCHQRRLDAVIPPTFPHQTGHGRFAKGRRRQGYRAVAHRRRRHRWPIERTNSWLSNFGQLRRNTDRTIRHRARPDSPSPSPSCSPPNSSTGATAGALQSVLALTTPPRGIVSDGF